jgi:hypothetical protein
MLSPSTTRHHPNEPHRRLPRNTATLFVHPHRQRPQLLTGFETVTSASYGSLLPQQPAVPHPRPHRAAKRSLTVAGDHHTHRLANECHRAERFSTPRVDSAIG